MSRSLPCNGLDPTFLWSTYSHRHGSLIVRSEWHEPLPIVVLHSARPRNRKSSPSADTHTMPIEACCHQKPEGAQATPAVVRTDLLRRKAQIQAIWVVALVPPRGYRGI